MDQQAQVENQDGQDVESGDNDLIRIRLPQCGHNFHYKCIVDWVQSQMKYNKQPECPSCRE